MRKILVTGGTVFVSKYVAEYFVKKGEDVYVLNRNNHKQVEGVHLMEGDRNALGEKLAGQKFDVVLDVNAYTGQDVDDLLDSGIQFEDYILISSSAVYPEYGIQPFAEDGELAENKFWGGHTEPIRLRQKRSCFCVCRMHTFFGRRIYMDHTIMCTGRHLSLNVP